MKGAQLSTDRPARVARLSVRITPRAAPRGRGDIPEPTVQSTGARPAPTPRHRCASCAPHPALRPRAGVVLVPHSPLTVSLRRFGRSSSTTLSPGFSAPLAKASWSCGRVRSVRAAGSGRPFASGLATAASGSPPSLRAKNPPSPSRSPRRTRAAPPLPPSLPPPPLPAACAAASGPAGAACGHQGDSDSDSGSGSMAGADVLPVAVFGCRPGVAGGVCFLEEQVVLHAAGTGCLRLHLEHKWHNFIPGGTDPRPYPKPRPGPDSGPS